MLARTRSTFERCVGVEVGWRTPHTPLSSLIDQNPISPLIDQTQSLMNLDQGMHIGYSVSPIMLVCTTTVAYLFPMSWRYQARRSFQFSVNRNPTLPSSAHRPNY